MLSVYLLRHGETPYNADNNRYCGRTDIELTTKGIMQAQGIKSQLDGMHIDAVYSSPLKRAKHTAQLATGRDPVADQRLIEIDFGNWENKTKDEFIVENPDLWYNWIMDPSNTKAGGTGESGNTIVARIDSFYNEMLERHANQTIVVVGHNGINRLFLAFKLGMPLNKYRSIFQENSAITLFELDEKGEITLKKLNA
jgi:broad specificity phosphatase PhoE